jgi:adenylate cyclase
MGQEIERKFLLKNEEFKKQAYRSIRIQQAYLSSHPERVVRIRIANDQAFLTIKGKGEISRYEWEKPIDLEEAKELIKLCEPGAIDKTRYLVKVEDFVFEVDEFFGENEGLLLAEIELQSEDEAYPKPNWLGEEVTGLKPYYNAYLKDHPFKNW